MERAPSTNAAKIITKNLFTKSMSFSTRSTTTRDRNQKCWGTFSTGFFEFSPVIVFFLSRFSVSFSKESPQHVEKIARFPSGEASAESCHISGCHGFLGPESWLRKIQKNRFTKQIPWLVSLQKEIHQWRLHYINLEDRNLLK